MRLALLTVISLVVFAALNSSSFGQTVGFRYEALVGGQNSISQVNVGDKFELKVYAQDLRELERGGVFAAYLDIEFDTAMVSVDGPIAYGDFYQYVQTGTVTDFGLANVGAVGFQAVESSIPGFTVPAPLGPDEFLVFSVPLQATMGGSLSFMGRPASDQFQNVVLVFGQNAGVDPTDVEFGSLAPFTVVPEPSSAVLLVLGSLVFIRRRH